MQLMDIVNRALMKSGAVPSFNPDEVPEDMQQRMADVFRNEIIPDLNCDRNVDISEIAIPYSPRCSIIDLHTTPINYPYKNYGIVPFTWDYIISEIGGNPGGGKTYKNLWEVLKAIGVVDYQTYLTVTKTDMWDTDQFGQYRKIAFWTSDYKLVEVTPDFNDLWVGVNHEVTELIPKLLNTIYNIPFAPMRIEGVYRMTTGEEFKYLHVGEMVSAEWRHSTFVYTVEEIFNCLRVRFNPNGATAPVFLILPVPVTIVNSLDEPHPWTGTIVAPPKFRSFFINTLAWRAAAEYGISTEDKMKEFTGISYGALLKSKIKREHPQDVERKIFDYLQRGRGMHSNGYTGGPYGR